MKEFILLFLLLINIKDVASIDKNYLIELSKLSKNMPQDMRNMLLCVYNNDVQITSLKTTLANINSDLIAHQFPPSVIEQINGIVFLQSIIMKSFSIFIGSPVRDQWKIVEGNLNEIIGIVDRNGDNVEILYSKITVNAYVFTRFKDRSLCPGETSESTSLDSCYIIGEDDSKYPVIGRIPGIACYNDLIYSCICQWEFCDPNTISSDQIDVVQKTLSYKGYLKLIEKLAGFTNFLE